MTTAVLRAVSDDPSTERLARVDEITAAARSTPFGLTMLLWFAAVLYGLGYGAAKVFGVVWFALVWTAMAVHLGWTEARKPKINNLPASDASA